MALLAERVLPENAALRQSSHSGLLTISPNLSPASRCGRISRRASSEKGSQPGGKFKVSNMLAWASDSPYLAENSCMTPALRVTRSAAGSMVTR